MRSRSFEQLKGSKYFTTSQLKDCDPIIKNKDVSKDLYSYFEKSQKLKEDDPAMPCGLVAKSFFNDTYELRSESGKNINIDSNGIAWESDKEYKFKLLTGTDSEGRNLTNLYWMDVTNGNLMT